MPGHVRPRDQGDLPRPVVELRIVGHEGLALQATAPPPGGGRRRFPGPDRPRFPGPRSRSGRPAPPARSGNPAARSPGRCPCISPRLAATSSRSSRKRAYSSSPIFSSAPRIFSSYSFSSGVMKPLRVAHGLLADVLAFQPVQVRFRDLDVVAEDAVVVHLEGLDPGALRAPSAAVRRSSAFRPELITRRSSSSSLYPARMSPPSVSDRGGSSTRARSCFSARGRSSRSPSRRLADNPAFRPASFSLMTGITWQGGLQRDQVAGVGALRPDPGGQPFHVPHGLEQAGEFVPRPVFRVELAHRPLAGQDGFHGDQRPGDGLAHETGAHVPCRSGPSRKGASPPVRRPAAR